MRSNAAAAVMLCSAHRAAVAGPQRRPRRQSKRKRTTRTAWDGDDTSSGSDIVPEQLLKSRRRQETPPRQRNTHTKAPNVPPGRPRSTSSKAKKRAPAAESSGPPKGAPAAKRRKVQNAAPAAKRGKKKAQKLVLQPEDDELQAPVAAPNKPGKAEQPAATPQSANTAKELPAATSKRSKPRRRAAPEVSKSKAKVTTVEDSDAEPEADATDVDTGKRSHKFSDEVLPQMKHLASALEKTQQLEELLNAQGDAAGGADRESIDALVCTSHWVFCFGCACAARSACSLPNWLELLRF